MPRRRRRRKRRKNKHAKVNTLIARGPRVVPDQMFVKMSYLDISAKDTLALGALSNYIYRGNSAFDPEQAVGGGQPLGFDQWSAFYNRYQIMGSKIEVEYLPDPATAPAQPVQLILVPTDSTTAITGLAQAMELPYSKSTLVPIFRTTSTKLSAYMSTKAKFGYGEGITQEDDLSALTTTNPAEQWYWQLVIGSAGNTATNGFGRVKITYYCRFFDRRDLLRS